MTDGETENFIGAIVEPEEEEEADAPPTPQPRRQRRARNPGSDHDHSRGMGAPPESPFRSRDAEELWGQIVAWLPSQHRLPSDVAIHITRMDPPPSPTVIGYPIDGGAVSGSETMSAADAFLRYFISYYHMPTVPAGAAGARYRVTFTWKVKNSTIAVGYLNLPDKVTTMNMLNAQNRAAQAAAVEPDQGMGMPVQYGRRSAPAVEAAQHYAPPPSYGYPPPGMGYPPPGYGPQQPDPMAIAGMMQDAWREGLAAAREGRPPMMPPMPQAPPPMSEDAIVAKVIMALQKLGVGNGPSGAAAPAVAAPLPPVAPAARETVGGLTGMVEKMVGGILENVVKSVGQNVERSIKSGLGMGAPPPAEEAPSETPPAAVAEAEKSELPWEVMPVGVNWGNGSPINYVKNKETGDFDLAGFAMANPVMGEKAADIVSGLAGAVQTAITTWATKNAQMAQRPAPPQMAPAPATPQVVAATPSGAVDATPPQGGGWQAP